MKQILTINAGSSSLKYALFNALQSSIKNVVATGIVEKIGLDAQRVKHSYEADGEKKKLEFLETSLHTHEDALKYTLSLLPKQSYHNICAVGHRVVHGGSTFTKAQVINSDVVEAIQNAIPLAPLHNPANLLGIDTAFNIFSSSVQQIAVFDTAFHTTIPKHAWLYGVPLELHEKYGVRKYGFHGISHEYVANKAADFLKVSINSLDLITCHLGAGSSIACIKKGISIDTSMGMTPLEGLIMATRCGDLDPSVVFYLAKHMCVEEIGDLLVNKSGWYALSGHKDARDLENAYDDGDVKSQDAVEAIVHRIRKYIGAYHWNLRGNTDVIVFTAGLGENWPLLRSLCLQNCEKFGFILDEQLNSKVRNVKETVEISEAWSPKKILVVPTDEEYSIADKVLKII